jgi:hypothetical protein
MLEDEFGIDSTLDFMYPFFCFEKLCLHDISFPCNAFWSNEEEHEDSGIDDDLCQR